MCHLITTNLDYQTSATAAVRPRAATGRPAIQRASPRRAAVIQVPEDIALAGSSPIPVIHSRPSAQHTHYAHSMDIPRQDPGRAALPWPAPQAGGPLRARLRVPGSKSMTNRALVLAALAAGPTDILSPLRGPGHAADGRRPPRARRHGDHREFRRHRESHGLRESRVTGGSVVTGGSADAGTTAWRVSPGWAASDARVDVGNAGTVMRFVPPGGRAGQRGHRIPRRPAGLAAAGGRDHRRAA